MYKHFRKSFLVSQPSSIIRTVSANDKNETGRHFLTATPPPSLAAVFPPKSQLLVLGPKLNSRLASSVDFDLIRISVSGLELRLQKLTVKIQTQRQILIRTHIQAQFRTI